MKTLLSRVSKHLAVLAALVAAPAYGQTISPQESANIYASTRGWSVYVIGDGRGLNSCRAVRGQGYNDQIMIEYDGFDEKWKLLVHANRPAGGGLGIKGAAVYYDGKLADRQVAFGISGEGGSSNSHAKMFMTDWDLGRVKAGSMMRIDINGEQSRSWSLSGTTAAILKVAECAGNFGFAPAGTTAAPVQILRATQPAAVDGNTVGYVVFAGGQYRNTGGKNWVEEGNNGSIFYFTEYNRTSEQVLLNDASRNIQIWIGLPRYEIRYTQAFDNNNWALLYAIDCYDRQASRSC